VPRHAAGRAERLGEGLLGCEAGRERPDVQPPFVLGEELRHERRRTTARLLEARYLAHVDPDADHRHGVYSTVTDLARLRGWSTSCPSPVASSHANSCSGTIVTRGCSRTGTF